MTLPLTVPSPSLPVDELGHRCLRARDEVARRYRRIVRVPARGAPTAWGCRATCYGATPVRTVTHRFRKGGSRM